MNTTQNVKIDRELLLGGIPMNSFYPCEKGGELPYKGWSRGWPYKCTK